MLCTQSPGDLDYRGRDNIRTWVLGAIREARAIEKIAGLLSESQVAGNALSTQKVGEFILAAEGQATPFHSLPSCVQTKQLSEDEILDVAVQGKE
jgi:hypothetical protein